MAATFCLGLSGCLGLGGEPPATASNPPPITDDRPRVAPTATPPSTEFNLQVAKPLTNPPQPVLEPVPVVVPPPPPATLEPLPIPDPITLAALPTIGAPPAPPQRGKPIPPPPGPPHDSVSALEAPPAVPPEAAPTAAAPAPPVPAAAVGAAPVPEQRRSTASLPVGGHQPAPAASGNADLQASYRVVFAGQSTDLPDTSAPLLRQLAALMTNDPKLRLKLNSFASGSADNPVAARKLSLQRALTLRQALVGFGISALRMEVLALGLAADAPADRIDIAPAN
jgi:outer membrane protein OmpA-like peptidoglycan-associated protein